MEQAARYKRFLYMAGADLLLFIVFSLLTFTIYEFNTVTLVVLSLLTIAMGLNVLLYTYYKNIYRQMSMNIADQEEELEID